MYIFFRLNINVICRPKKYLWLCFPFQFPVFNFNVASPSAMGCLIGQRLFWLAQISDDEIQIQIQQLSKYKEMGLDFQCFCPFHLFQGSNFWLGLPIQLPLLDLNVIRFNSHSLSESALKSFKTKWKICKDQRQPTFLSPPPAWWPPGLRVEVLADVFHSSFRLSIFTWWTSLCPYVYHVDANTRPSCWWNWWRWLWWW